MLKIFKMQIIHIMEIIWDRFTILKSKNRFILRLMGFIALIWFLIRVIPKPSRALYPCQKAAFPAASAFVIWLMGIALSSLSFLKAKTYYRSSRHFASVFFLAAALIIFAVTQLNFSLESVFAGTEEVFTINNLKADSTIVHPEAVVSIVRSNKEIAEDIDSLEIYDMVRQAVEMAGGFDELIKDNMVVVIKPNLLMAHVVDDNLIPQRLLPEKVNSVTTDYRVIQAVVNLVRERNPNGKVYIMEGSAVGSIRDNMHKMGWFKITGVDAIYPLDEICGNWRDTNAGELVKVSLPPGKNLYSIANNQYYLNKIYYEADVLISLPALKTHSNCAVTGAVKNVGIGAAPVNIYGSSTSNPWRFDVIEHTGTNYSNLHNWIHDYYMCRPVDYAIMDALTGMQNGPSPGINDAPSLAKKNTRCIIASKDPIAMDAIESLVIQVDPSRVRHLVRLHNDSLGCVDPRYIKVKGIRVDEIKDRYSNWAGYGRYTDFTGPVVSINNYSFTEDSLFISLNSGSDLIKVEISINGNMLPQICTGNFNNIILKPGVQITDPEQIKIYTYDKFLNCTILQPSTTRVKESTGNKDFFLGQNFPNPFNPVTTINYSVPVGTRRGEFMPVVLKIYDIVGNEITTLVNEEKEPGYYIIQWNANQVASGTYFCVMQAGEFKAVKKMILLK